MAKKPPPSAGMIAFAILIGVPFFAMICMVGVIGILLLVSAALTFRATAACRPPRALMV